MRRAPGFLILVSAALLLSGCVSTGGLERTPSPSPAATEAGINVSPFTGLEIIDPDYAVPEIESNEIARTVTQGGEDGASRSIMSTGEADSGVPYTLRFDCTPAEARVTFKATGSASGVVASSEGCASPSEVTGLMFGTASEVVSVEIESHDDTLASAWATLAAVEP